MRKIKILLKWLENTLSDSRYLLRVLFEVTDGATAPGFGAAATPRSLVRLEPLERSPAAALERSPAASRPSPRPPTEEANELIN